MQPLFTGQNIVRLTSVGSTNNYTTEKLRQSVMPEGTVVVAETQTSGKGQRGNTWHTQPGKNLTFSLVYYPTFIPADKQFVITQAVSLGLADFLINCQIPDVKVKWPNDIYVAGKKIAGVLIETAIAGNQLKHAVIGIGLNVNQLTFPTEIAATSMQAHSGVEHKLDELLMLLCHSLEARYLQLKSNPKQTEADYHQHLYLLGQESSFTASGQPLTGTITGVTPQGKLKVASSGGIEQEFNFKEIEFLS